MASGKYVGAIRWDFWYANTGSAASVARAVGNPNFRDRAPVHTTELSSNAVEFSCSQAIMDAEITAAVNGGLAYWAFLYYPPSAEDSPTVAKQYYDSSSIKGQMPWCQIRDTEDWGTTANHSTQVTEITNNCLQSNYFKVLTNRPLIYILYYPDAVTSNFGGNTNFKTAIDEVRAAVQSGGAGDPYIVILQGGASSASATATALGADAISDYFPALPSSSTLNGTYAALDTAAEAYWTAMVGTGKKVIPICSMGWNRGPRIARPHTFERNSQKPYFDHSKVWATPTDAEAAAHFQNAIDFINANASACESNTILTYAWNECDEGGWMLPTIGDPDGDLLAAISSTIAT